MELIAFSCFTTHSSRVGIECFEPDREEALPNNRLLGLYSRMLGVAFLRLDLLSWGRLFMLSQL